MLERTGETPLRHSLWRLLLKRLPVPLPARLEAVVALEDEGAGETMIVLRRLGDAEQS